jgi:cell division protein FtsB
MEQRAREWAQSRQIDSLNFKMTIMLVLVIIGIMSNVARTINDIKDDTKQARIVYLDKRIIELEQRIEDYETGVPRPQQKD